MDQEISRYRGFLKTVVPATAFTSKFQFSSKNITRFSVHKSTVQITVFLKVLWDRKIVLIKRVDTEGTVFMTPAV